MYVYVIDESIYAVIMWDNVRELIPSIPSFLHVSLGDQMWVIRVGSNPRPHQGLSAHPANPFDINSIIQS